MKNLDFRQILTSGHRRLRTGLAVAVETLAPTLTAAPDNAQADELTLMSAHLPPTP